MPDRSIQCVHDTVLHGGNQTGGIVRRGDTVCRPARPWSPAIRVLLEHLATAAPGIAPRHLGTDEHGRDVLSFVTGPVGHYPLEAAMRSDEALVAAARLLRRYHDATVDLVKHDDLPWQYHDPNPSRREVICHSDVAPYNTVYRDGLPVTLIDFDHAGPGPRLWDLAYAVYRFAPLASDASCRDFGWPEPPDRIARARVFLATYSWLDTEGIVAMAERRIELLRDDILLLAATQPERVGNQLVEDHIGSYNSDLAWVTANRDKVERVLKGAPLGP